jgi:membrane-associated phospholipid phosphatase
VIVWEEWHYPSDVLAGWCLALGCALGLWVAFGRPTLANAPNVPSTNKT